MDHMKSLWTQIEFNPTNLELSSTVENNFIHPAETETSDQDKNQTSEPDGSERLIGLSIANISFKVGDKEVFEFIKEYVDETIKEEDIDIIRDRKKAVATVSHSISSKVIKEAMSKINFSECKSKFFGLPLYCRPLRNLTPEKAPSSNVIPGLPTDVPVNALNKRVQKKINVKNDFKKGNDASRPILRNESENGPNSDSISDNGTTP